MKIKQLLIGSAICSLTLTAGAGVGAIAASTEGKVSPGSLAPGMVSNSKATNVLLNMNALHRLDFIVKGKSCASCLFKMQKRLEALLGVAKVGIMLRKPFAGVVIFDSTKVDQAKILQVAHGDEASISFVQVEEAPIAKIPLILIPHHATDANQGTANN